MQTGMGVPEVLTSIGTALVSALLGFLGAVAVFRAKFEVIDAKREALETQIERDRQADKEMAEREMAELRRMLEKSCKDTEAFHARIERRQEVNLQLLSAMAVKQGVTHRALGTDALARIVTDAAQDTER